MKLYLVRHGETELNKKFLINYENDSLTDKGLKQAELIGKKLKNVKFDKIYTSDFKRTMKTTEFISKFHEGVPVVSDKRLREHNPGVFENHPWGSVEKEAERKNMDFENFKPEKGESLIEVRERVKSFFDGEVRGFNGDVLLVSHGMALSTLMTVILCLDLSDWRKNQFHNTGLYVLEILGESVEILSKNDTHHLTSQEY